MDSHVSILVRSLKNDAAGSREALSHSDLNEAPPIYVVATVLLFEKMMLQAPAKLYRTAI